MTPPDKICLCGDGHGAVAAMRSLVKTFDAVEVVSQDLGVLSQLRQNDWQLSELENAEGKVIVCAGYGKLIGSEILERNTVINTHPSLLPKYRGMHSLVWAMLNDEQELGFSIHLMNEEIDDGDILDQFRLKNAGQTSKEIWEEFDHYVQVNLGAIVQKYLKGVLKPVPQDRSRASWVPRRNLDDCNIDFTDSNARIRALFRALVAPYPFPRIVTKRGIYSVTDADVIDKSYYCTIGRVVSHLEGDALIKTADGLLRIKGLEDVETRTAAPVQTTLPIGARLK